MAALRKLGRDTARVECWSGTVSDALAQVLARSRARAFTAIEEALLLRDLMDGQRLSQRDAACQCGRDVSWVQRRLQLLGEVSDAVLEAVRRAQVSTWAAVRVFVPLARANTDHAQRLLASLGKPQQALSTRELNTWFAQYRCAQRSQRERMVEHPRLFIDSVNERERERAATQLKGGPEQQAVAELGHLQAQLERARRALGALQCPVGVCRWRAHAAACARLYPRGTANSGGWVMTPMEISNSVRALKTQGRSLHEISRLLRLSRNTVRRILREPDAPAATPPVDAAMQQRLKEAYVRAQGNAVRIAQILADEHGMAPSYSTLTRWVRQAELRAAPKRSGEYHFAPGEEMQHDTSPHRVMIAGKTLTAQCAALTLAYSRRLFVRYYLRFTRAGGQTLLAAGRAVHGRHLPALRDRQHQRDGGGRGRRRGRDRP